MSDGKRVGFILDADQIEQACVAFIQSRLQTDEVARGTLMQPEPGNVSDVRCQIEVSKKRKPREKKQSAGDGRTVSMEVGTAAVGSAGGHSGGTGPAQ